MPTPLTDATWRITYLPASPSEKPRVETVRAAYVTGQEDLYGWTILKDREHRIVKMVRVDFATDIERIEPGDGGAGR
jgi:uncharacterized protein involved in type VI secretion and phage assembly